VSRPPRRKARPQALGELLSRVLADLGGGETARALRIAERWESTLGADVAAHSRPVALRRDVLEVAVDSSVWCQQLQLRSPEILAALRESVGDDAPERLWLRVRQGG
jgi:predicted nucleic acid-binding Zn ribbon protein